MEELLLLLSYILGQIASKRSVVHFQNFFQRTGVRNDNHGVQETCSVRNSVFSVFVNIFKIDNQIMVQKLNIGLEAKTSHIAWKRNLSSRDLENACSSSKSRRTAAHTHVARAGLAFAPNESFGCEMLSEKKCSSEFYNLF